MRIELDVLQNSKSSIFHLSTGPAVYHGPVGGVSSAGQHMVGHPVEHLSKIGNLAHGHNKTYFCSCNDYVEIDRCLDDNDPFVLTHHQDDSGFRRSLRY